MPCASYTDPRLAAVYDPLNPPSLEDRFFLEVAQFLAEAGFDRVTWHGDWDGAPFGPASPEIIAVAGYRS